MGGTGEPIAQISPYKAAFEEQIEKMLDAGMATWNKQAFSVEKPVAKLQSETLASDIIVEEREHTPDDHNGVAS